MIYVFLFEDYKNGCEPLDEFTDIKSFEQSAKSNKLTGEFLLLDNQKKESYLFYISNGDLKNARKY